MRIIEKLISLIGIEVVDSSIKTTSQELLDDVFKNKFNNIFTFHNIYCP